MSGPLLEDAAERRRREGEELRRRKLLHRAEGSSWRLIPLADLSFGRHFVEDTETGERFRVYRGEVDATHTPVVAWAVTVDGPVFLEPI